MVAQHGDGFEHASLAAHRITIRIRKNVPQSPASVEASPQRTQPRPTGASATE